MLSIDFLAGFTIFLLALIVAAGMIPGMLAGLQSATIDYDGVAYRTSVILAEDPGWYEDASDGSNPMGYAWESRRDEAVKRLGLAVSKDTPDVLSMAKISRFFDQTEDPGYYRDRLFFSDIPYSFNITLNLTDDSSAPYTLGEPLPESDYGYIRRVVMVKENSSATLDFTKEKVRNAYAAPAIAPSSKSSFNVSLNVTELLNLPPAYGIDPFGERINITLENLNETFYSGAKNASLTDIKLHWGPAETSTGISVFNDPDLHLYVDGNQEDTLPTEIEHNLTLILNPGFFTGKAPNDKNTLTIRDLEFIFANSPGTNTTLKNTFTYTPTDTNVTVPDLKQAVLEVAVW